MELTGISSMKDYMHGHVGHVLGGGPSLLNTDKSVFENKLTVGVNGVARVIPSMKYGVLLDNDAYNQVMGIAENYTWFVGPSIAAPRINHYRITQSKNGIQDDPIKNGFFWHGASTHCAADILRYFGCKVIILWGIDYHDRSHAYAWNNATEKWDTFNSIQQKWLQLKSEMAGLGVSMFNANPKSRLQGINFISPDKALEIKG